MEKDKFENLENESFEVETDNIPDAPDSDSTVVFNISDIEESESEPEFEDGGYDEIQDGEDDEFGFAEEADAGALYIDEDERRKAEKFKLPIVAIIAVTFAVVFSFSCFAIIKLSDKKAASGADVTSTTAYSYDDYSAEVVDGQLYINGVAIDNDDVGISEDEVEEYAQGVNNGTIKIDSSTAATLGVAPSGSGSSSGGSSSGNNANSGSSNATSSSGSASTAESVEIIKIRNVSFLESSKEIEVGSSEKCRWRFEPYDTTQKGITFTSNNENVATVNHLGVVKGLKLGTAVITVTSKVDPSISDTIKITVVNEKTTASPITRPSTTAKPTTAPTTTKPTTQPPVTDAPTTQHTPVAVTGIKLLYSEHTLQKGGSVRIRYTITPSDATALDLKFTSSDTSVCTVSDTGIISAKSEGTAYIKIESRYGSCDPVTCKVIVRDNV